MTSPEQSLLIADEQKIPVNYKYNEISPEGVLRIVYVSYTKDDNGVYKSRRQFKIMPTEANPVLITARKPRTLKPAHLKKVQIKHQHEPMFNDITATVKRCFRKYPLVLTKFSSLSKEEQNRFVLSMIDTISL